MFISAATAVIKTIQKLIGFLLSFHAVYFITGLFTTRKFPPAKKQHKYAVLVAARNEEKVIGNLIDSIHMQDYPSELVTVFDVATTAPTERQKSFGNGGLFAMSGRTPTTGQRDMRFSIL